MHVSEHYKLGLHQGELDFVDVSIETDTPLFIDPRALLLVRTDWGQECVALVQDYFRSVLEAIKAGNDGRAAALLGQLHEPNETRLGMSHGKPQGHALGPELAGRVRLALTSSGAVTTGLLTDLEDTILMIEGIGEDLISDITTNVIREPLVRYTQQMADSVGIPLVNGIYAGPFWDPAKHEWYQEYARLPRPQRPLLLVPKAIVRMRIDYDPDEFYTDFIIPLLREQEFSDPGSSLVNVLKNGESRVTRKDLEEKYGRGKAVNEQIAREHPEVLEAYRRSKDRIKAPMNHAEMAGFTSAPPTDWDALLTRVLQVKPGRDTANDYHVAVQALLTPLFYPALTMPKREDPIHGGRKRIDITFSNVASTGFFYWLGLHHEAATVFVECKNYSNDVANNELDQLAGRFSRERGRFGILMSRSFADKDLFLARCHDTSVDGRGFIIPLDDGDLTALVESRKNDGDPQGAFLMLRERFNALVM